METLLLLSWLPNLSFPSTHWKISSTVVTHWGGCTILLNSLFENSERGTLYHSLWEKVKEKQEYYLFQNDMEGLTNVLTKPNYVALIENLFYQHLDSENGSLKCQLVRAEREILPSFFALPFQKKSPYVAAFSVK